MAEIGIALLRKVLFIALLLGTYLLVDRKLLPGFNTPEVIKHDPKAVAVLLAGLAIAVSLA